MKVYLLVAVLIGSMCIESLHAIDLVSLSRSGMMTEETRYIGSDGMPINLARTTGHTRLDLTRIKKFAEPRPIEDSFLQLEGSSQAISKHSSNSSTEELKHCPINKPGQKVSTHIVQRSLSDNAYVSDIYVGNPP